VVVGDVSEVDLGVAGSCYEKKGSSSFMGDQQSVGVPQLTARSLGDFQKRFSRHRRYPSFPRTRESRPGCQHLGGLPTVRVARSPLSRG